MASVTIHTGPLFDSWKYDIARDQWTAIDSNYNINRTGTYGSRSISGGRSHFASVFDNLQRRIVIVGGRGFGNETSQGTSQLIEF